jgi:hypothetical protein
MAKYKITNIDDKTGNVTFQILNGTTVLITDTRGGLPVDNKEQVDEILSEVANQVEANLITTITIDPELTKIVNKAQEAKVSEPVEG